jgi:Plasma-membrane choline transporter
VHEEGDGEDRDDDLFGSEEEQRRRDVAGLAASWKPTAPFRSNRGLERDVIPESEESELGESAESDRTTRPLRSGVIPQESVMEGDGHYFFNPEDSQMSTDQPPEDLHVEVPLDDDDDDDNSESSRTSERLREAPPAPIYQSEMPEQSFHSYPPRQPLPEDTLPRPVSAPPLSAPSHDSTWAAFYGLAMAGMFATAFMIWLGTEAPTNGLPLGDTIYSTLHSAYPLLLSDAVLAIGIALLWIILMRHALQPFIYLLLFTVPISMFTLFLVPLIQSFGGRWEGDTFQDKAMRWASIIPALIGVWWTYKMWKGRHSLGRAVSIISLAGKVVTENQALVGFSFAVLGGFIAFTFIWVLMFSRVFLRNYKVVDGGMSAFDEADSVMSWAIPTSSWWLGAYFIFMFLWTWGVFSGIQR